MALKSQSSTTVLKTKLGNAVVISLKRENSYLALNIESKPAFIQGYCQSCFDFCQRNVCSIMQYPVHSLGVCYSGRSQSCFGNKSSRRRRKKRKHRSKVKYISTYIRQGRVMFFKRAGRRTTNAFHSSLEILPSPSVCASTNVCWRKDEDNTIIFISTNR